MSVADREGAGMSAREWLRRWFTPMDIDAGEKSEDHPLDPFLSIWRVTLLSSLLSGVITGFALRGAGLGVPSSDASTFYVWWSGTSLTLFVATELRYGGHAQSSGATDLFEYVLRAVVSLTLLLGAIFSVIVVVLSFPKHLIVGPTAWILYSTLFSGTRPDQGTFSAKATAAELKALATVRSSLYGALIKRGPAPEPYPTGSQSAALRSAGSVIILAAVPAVISLGVGLILTYYDNGTAETAILAGVTTWLLVGVWSALSVSLLQVKAYSRSRSWGALASSAVNVTVLALIMVVFASLGVYILWLMGSAGNPSSGFTWVGACAISIAIVSFSSMRGWPSPRYATSETYRDVVRRISKLEEREMREEQKDRQCDSSYSAVRGTRAVESSRSSSE